jgi:hypothetical protein
MRSGQRTLLIATIVLGVWALVITFFYLGTHSALTEARAELTSTRAELASTRQALTETRDDLTDTRTELAITGVRLTAAEATLSQTSNDLAVTKTSLDSTKAQLATTQTELTGARASVADLSQKLASANANLADAQSQLTSSQSLLTAYKKTMDALNVTVHTSTETWYFNSTTWAHTNNTQASSPTWNQLVSFIYSDKTDQNPYNVNTYNCVNYATTVYNNAEARGIDAALVTIQFKNQPVGHALNAFVTSDYGLVYIDSTSRDTAARVKAGQVLRAVDLGAANPGQLSNDAYWAGLTSYYYIASSSGGQAVVDTIDFYW